MADWKATGNDTMYEYVLRLGEAAIAAQSDGTQSADDIGGFISNVFDRFVFSAKPAAK